MEDSYENLHFQCLVVFIWYRIVARKQAAEMAKQPQAFFVTTRQIVDMSTRKPKSWIAVASAKHVRHGITAGIMQVCHGKRGPLQRVLPGDRVAYYSPTESFGGKDKCQAFTACGVVKEGDPYQFDMGEGFMPFRRDVSWLKAKETPIRPLLDTLAFSSGNKNWGYQLRFGLFEISNEDMNIIAEAMQT
jgi:hypothetical protein